MSGKPAEGDGLEILAPAKVNLSLRIISRRDDGYHELLSLMLKLELADRLRLTPQSRPGLALYCPDSDLPEDDGNLVYRAAAAFYRQTGLAPALAISLYKKIPTAAGLGGGSSDAAAVLRGLQGLHPGVLSPAQLHQLARGLGADVPFFLQPQAAAWARGIGDILTPVAPPPAIAALVLVNPGFAVATKWVYEQLAGNFPLTNRADPFTLTGSLADGGEGEIALVNDLAAVTIRRYPELATIAEQLLAAGADAALLAGSGPTVFGIFRRRQQAAVAAERLRELYPLVYLTRPLPAPGE